MGLFSALITIFYYWLLIVLILAFAIVFLSVAQISLGIHDLYTRFLLFLFDWSREKLEGYGEDDDDETIASLEEFSNSLRNDLQNNDEIPDSQLGSQFDSPFDSQFDSLLNSELGTHLDSRLHSQLHSQLNSKRSSSRSPRRRRVPSGNLQAKKLFKPEAKVDLYTRLNSIPAENQLLSEIVEDSAEWMKWGIERIIYDDVTESFASAELPSWNLLTRTDRGYAFISWRVTLVWVLGTLFRFFILLPVRTCIFLMSILFLCITCPLFGYFVPEGPWLRWLDQWMNLVFYRMLSRAISLDARFHHVENRAMAGGICVANHTSPIDVLVLCIDNQYCLVGQQHEGFLGLVERLLNWVTPHIWFERQDRNDREKAAKRIQDHTQSKMPPILLFPEGVCVNNQAILQFRKRTFEYGAPIYPVAIKYDPRFGNPFWVQDYMYSHIWDMITSWGIKCDIYYLPPMKMEENENSEQFAERVKRLIALKGGLVDVNWDGMVKYMPVKSEMIQQIRELYAARIKHKLLLSNN